eukprot:10166203-Ditylum_brightwellii.AAC.2
MEMSGVVHMKCPMCIAADVHEAILQMNVMGRSGIGVIPSMDDALHSITFVLGNSFAVPFEEELLKRLLAHVAFRCLVWTDELAVDVSAPGANFC